ncbi:MAG: phosphoribosylanthranilate isomerase [Clostridiales bacterium]|nr:phosphoribosylanthranilate isomerase [Clostridiales bacterium]
MKVKICGLTRPCEAEYLNEAGADFAGFVFFEKSKRNVTPETSDEIKKLLSDEIKTVAVTVSPDEKKAEMLQSHGFDILQVHGDLSEAVLDAINIPVWYAINLSGEDELKNRLDMFLNMPESLQEKVTGFVIDGAEYGGGKTFDWEAQKNRFDGVKKSFPGREMILAGGLNAENVQQGIAMFSPDIVDVSSGVEDGGGKNRDEVMKFIRRAREHEK